jgi:PadR family transcriptional regulator, regulatory protein PadR
MRRSTRSDGPRMTLQTLAVLKAMLNDPTAPRYGLEIAGAVGLPTGTIYPILARLEQACWVSSAWENADPAEEGRPRRRLYLLTGEGATNARSEVRKTLGFLLPQATPTPGGFPTPGRSQA